MVRYVNRAHLVLFLNHSIAYSCSVSVESKTRAADLVLFDVLKHKLKLEQIDVSNLMTFFYNA